MGFFRMKRQGFPLPIYSVELKVKNILTKSFKGILQGMLMDFIARAKDAGITPGEFIQDGPEDPAAELRAILEQLAKAEENALSVQEKADLRMKAGNILSSLESDWQSSDLSNLGLDEELAELLLRNQTDFMKRIQSDFSYEIKDRLNGFSIDQRALYNNLMGEIRQLYLDNSRERVKGEQNLLKLKFLNAINDYVTGATDTLDIQSVTKDLYESSTRMARFFARDQLARLNKATTIATFQQAGVRKVKWITSHDARVRETHRALDGKVFDVDDLPPELDDYNCRCGLVPVEYD